MAPVPRANGPKAPSHLLGRREGQKPGYPRCWLARPEGQLAAASRQWLKASLPERYNDCKDAGKLDEARSVSVKCGCQWNGCWSQSPSCYTRLFLVGLATFFVEIGRASCRERV